MGRSARVIPELHHVQLPGASAGDHPLVELFPGDDLKQSKATHASMEAERTP